MQIPVPGMHMVLNAMAACGVGLSMGLSIKQIKKGIEELKPVRGRTNIIYGENYTVIDDCYNANPVSMKASIDVLTDAVGRKVCILGDMFELGEKEADLHKQVGEYAAVKDLNLLVTIGNLSRYIHDAASACKHCRCVHFENKAQALEALPELLKRGDSILVKASHGMEFPEIVDFLCK